MRIPKRATGTVNHPARALPSSAGALLLISFFITVSVAFPAASLAQTEAPTDTTTGWTRSEHGATFWLRQIPPDQVRAFYIGRGFSIDQIQPYAATCVFTTILRNDNAPGHIHFIRDRWEIIHNGKRRHPRGNAAWLQQFKQDGVTPSALIAFRLAQIPEEQEYAPDGDWNQGMLSVDVPIGDTFDIIVRWDIKGKPYELTLEGISCVNSEN